MVRSFVLFFLVASSAFAFQEDESLRKIREHVLALEQVCSLGNFSQQPRFAASQTDRFLAKLAELRPSLKKHGIRDEAPPENWDFTAAGWAGRTAWLLSLLRLLPEERCERIALAYTYAVIQLSTLPPTSPVTGIRDLMFKQITPEIQLDRQRAAWALRHTKFLPSWLYPFECADFESEATLRWNYIFTKRKPLGYAIGMCVRPMNAHYLDDQVINKKRPEPLGWTGTLPD